MPAAASFHRGGSPTCHTLGVVGPALLTPIDALVGTGPHVMSFESRVRTPEVPFGDKFEVAIRFVLIKEGPEKVRSTNAEASSLVSCVC